MSKEHEDEFLAEDEFLTEEEGMMEEFSEVSEDEMLEEFPSEDSGDATEGEFSEESAEVASDELNSDEFVSEESSEAEFLPGTEATTDAEPEEDKPIMYRPPRMDLYTVLLVLSLVFVSLAAAIHFLECPPTEYGTVPFKKSSPVVSAPMNP
ncbi:MAG: hypothetical protein Q4C70_02675 [Planctomycetia bacterium]|nr:hypothetical protein [Planctomycetia bacterium]